MDGNSGQGGAESHLSEEKPPPRSCTVDQHFKIPSFILGQQISSPSFMPSSLTLKPPKHHSWVACLSITGYSHPARVQGQPGHGIHFECVEFNSLLLLARSTPHSVEWQTVMLDICSSHSQSRRGTPFPQAAGHPQDFKGARIPPPLPFTSDFFLAQLWPSKLTSNLLSSKFPVSTSSTD